METRGTSEFADVPVYPSMERVMKLRQAFNYGAAGNQLGAAFKYSSSITRHRYSGFLGSVTKISIKEFAGSYSSSYMRVRGTFVQDIRLRGEAKGYARAKHS